jgi:hypothetical protein
VAQFDFDGDGRDELVVTDADGDGRPDFVNDAYFGTAEPCTKSGGHGIYGAPLLVHSLPDGTFTMSDDLSRRWARRECPKAPDAGGEIEPSCQRLWGRSVEEILRVAPTQKGPCGWTSDMLKEFLHRAPPFPPLRAGGPEPLPGARWQRTDALWGEYGQYKD